MSMHDADSKNAPVQITEDEGALYDRQIRLWGLEAQQRMRNATILIVRLRGVATETIKNLVLAGIGKLIVVDGDEVTEEDLGAGFFFRDDDVGKKRVDAAKARIEGLNPLVTVETVPTASVLERDKLDGVVSSVDLVCVTDWDRDGLIRVNEACRRLGKPLYFGGTYGLLGYIFCDLLNHDYIAPDRSGANKNVMASATYSPLHVALRHRWSSLTRRQTKELNPVTVFTILAIWEFESLHRGNLPDSPAHVEELEAIAKDLIAAADVNKQVLTTLPRDYIETVATTAVHEFAPVCAVVGGYGPYAHNPGAANGNYNNLYTTSRFTQSDVSSSTGEKPGPAPGTSTIPPYMWDTKDPDLDDALHNPDPIRDAALDRSFTLWSARGWMNVSALVIIIAGLLMLFAGYPIISFYRRTPLETLGSNFGGSNSTGQIPSLINLPQLIDPDTDPQFHTKVTSDGQTWNLVFSDEFNKDGRTFWPGDDPFWEAVDFQYWPTGDLEWYNPQACFKDGTNSVSRRAYSRSRLACPGAPKLQVSGQVLGRWETLSGRAGYGATTEGTWPYSYDACDLGAFPNQTNPDGQGPPGALEGSLSGGPISFQPGQRLSSCTCDGSDHPGPNVKTGRSAPEIDVIEAQIDVNVFRGEASQSFQTAPFNYQYKFDNSSGPTTISDSSITKLNSYTGGTYQQALSAVTYLDSQNYNGQGYAPYGFEWWSNPKNREEGYIQWSVNDQPTWKLTAASLAGDPESQISSRLIPEEPMYIILNFGMSPSFQKQDFMHLEFPSHMYVDYVRVYQSPDVQNGVGCNPPSHPTTDYINK
ncbi:hypothetical protein EWM64_g1400 [Hericium alpestre]|uniref:GH16 domain-containing protein n=1 Tax=Hericium alpestre TaxID=135208 RepID=A0A4Z0A8L7_9AGAM|nr:hypothetical protein EWM64_g1400 [Hericium alpestre]